jgi:hypothetical protein
MNAQLFLFLEVISLQIARKLEAVNPTKEPLKSGLLNGKWELLYTTSQSILQTQVSSDTMLFLCIFQFNPSKYFFCFVWHFNMFGQLTLFIHFFW